VPTSRITTTPDNGETDIVRVAGYVSIFTQQILLHRAVRRDPITLIFTLTLLSGVNLISVDVIQHHLEGFWDSVAELYFQKRKVLEWHLSRPKQLHETHDMLSIACIYTLFILHIAYLTPLEIVV
jgi:hypothetical protein